MLNTWSRRVTAAVLAAVALVVLVLGGFQLLGGNKSPNPQAAPATASGSASPARPTPATAAPAKATPASQPNRDPLSDENLACKVINIKMARQIMAAPQMSTVIGTIGSDWSECMYSSDNPNDRQYVKDPRNISVYIYKETTTEFQTYFNELSEEYRKAKESGDTAYEDAEIRRLNVRTIPELAGATDAYYVASVWKNRQSIFVHTGQYTFRVRTLPFTEQQALQVAKVIISKL